jgi:hypothetical protein
MSTAIENAATARMPSTLAASSRFWLLASSTSNEHGRVAESSYAPGLKSWPAWVPIFNVWRLLQLGGQKGWWVLVGIIPVVETIAYLVFLIIAGINIQTAFGKPGIFYLLAILITPVW